MGWEAEATVALAVVKVAVETVAVETVAVVMELGGGGAVALAP